MKFKEKLALIQQLKGLSSSFKQEEEQNALRQQQQSESDYLIGAYGQQQIPQGSPTPEQFSTFPLPSQRSYYDELTTSNQNASKLMKANQDEVADFNYQLNRLNELGVTDIPSAINTSDEARRLYEQIVSENRYNEAKQETAKKEAKSEQEKAIAKKDKATEDFGKLSKSANKLETAKKIVSPVLDKYIKSKIKYEGKKDPSFEKQENDKRREVFAIQKKLKNNEPITLLDQNALLANLGYLKDDKKGNLSPNSFGTELMKAIDDYNEQIETGQDKFGLGFDFEQ